MQLFIFTMHDIIPIFTSNFNNSKINSVNARRLYQFLEIKKDFSNWIKNRLEDFIENEDFIKLAQKVELSKTGQVGIEYIVTLDVAKHISIYRITSKGFEYFRKKLVEKKPAELNK